MRGDKFVSGRTRKIAAELDNFLPDWRLSLLSLLLFMLLLLLSFPSSRASLLNEQASSGRPSGALIWAPNLRLGDLLLGPSAPSSCFLVVIVGHRSNISGLARGQWREHNNRWTQEGTKLCNYVVAWPLERRRTLSASSFVKLELVFLKLAAEWRPRSEAKNYFQGGESHSSARSARRQTGQTDGQLPAGASEKPEMVTRSPPEQFQHGSNFGAAESSHLMSSTWKLLDGADEAAK